MQGSGKSTQAKMLADKLNIPYIEMGQLLRNRAQQEDETGRQIKKALDEGILVPDEITIALLKEKLASKEAEDGFVLDGYPRNETQLSTLPESIDKVLYIKVSDTEAQSRLTKRARHDDTPELIKKRIEIYYKDTDPLLEYFRSKNFLEEINGEKSIEEVNSEIENRLNLTN